MTTSGWYLDFPCIRKLGLVTFKQPLSKLTFMRLFLTMMRRHFYDGSDGELFVFDITRRDSLQPSRIGTTT